MGTDRWWDWSVDRARSDGERCEMSDGERAMAIEKLADRCVVLDNLASYVTIDTIKTALEQFGTVRGVKMLMNPWNMSFTGTAIAEMRNKTERDQVVQQLSDYLFMVGAIPRPARAFQATPFLLFDHPLRRNLNAMKPRLVKKTDPGFKTLQERERRQRRKVNDEILLQRQMEQEEVKLQAAQESNCRDSMEKLHMIKKELEAGTIMSVKRMYGLDLSCQ